MERKWVDQEFGQRVKTERERLGWTQPHLAKMLYDSGIHPMHAVTIAKIEGGDRSVRINEALGLADVFGVSLDALLGRISHPRDDAHYAARALLDAVQQASWQVESIETTVRDRLAELAAIPGPKGFALGFPAACEAACDRLTDAADALHDALNPPEGKPFKRALRKMMIAKLQEEDSADDTQS